MAVQPDCGFDRHAPAQHVVDRFGSDVILSLHYGHMALCLYSIKGHHSPYCQRLAGTCRIVLSLDLHFSNVNPGTQSTSFSPWTASKMSNLLNPAAALQYARGEAVESGAGVDRWIVAEPLYFITQFLGEIAS